MTDTKKNQSQNSPKSNRRNQGGPGHGMPLGRPAEKAKDFKGTTKRLIKYIGQYEWLMLIVIIVTILTTLLAVVAPNYSRFIINDLQQMIVGTLSQDAGITRIRNFFLLIIILQVIRFLLSMVMFLVGNKVSVFIGKKMRNDIREKFEKMPIKYFDSRQTGDILSVVSNDVDVVTNSIQQSLINIISSFFSVVGILVMMFIISWRLTIIALLILPLFILATSTIAKKSQSKFIRQQKQLGSLNGHIEEVFSASKIVKLFGKEEESFEEFQGINTDLAVDMRDAQFLSGLIRPIMEFISNIGYVAVVIVGGILAGATNPLLVGDITIFITYQKNFVNPILNIANVINQLQSTIAGAERIFEVLDQPEESQDFTLGEVNNYDFKGHVEFKDIDFSYSEDKELIKDLNLEVYPGKQIAIVGPTGAGKTTLVNLLMRFYEVNNGGIYIDGIKSTDYPRSVLRKQFGMVLQDTWLFSGTIKENVAFGKPDATDEEIIKACKQAHVHHYIETLPKGYDTVLKEDADNISKGQKQLLTIARAILFDPKILILDEATSSVDTRTESYIQNAMTFMMEGKTSFVIAHRLSTIKKAHTILVMNNGRIVEQGNHKELLLKNGVYADLYNSQFLNQPT
ncbi:MAG: ABC transporter ATP-binding protein [Candidatus Izemoplasmatales bacterium]|jgi:ATP-binding cassette subfamily B protein|nr:ABC transporter ATP-binding protein [Candidatus Izemoplasmatales bacterium]